MIERDKYTPLYIQFHDLLKTELEKYPIGANLPPERALCEQYDLDRVTVRKALAMLADEGFIERKQGRGTRVISHDEQRNGTVLFALCHGSPTVDRLGEPFYARSMDALESQLQKINMRLVYSKLLRGDSLSNLSESLEARAIILAGTPDQAILDQCLSMSVPVVGYNTRLDNLPCVLVNNDNGAALSARHMLELGHKCIGFIHVPGHLNSDRRLNRYKIEMRSAGLNENALRIAVGDWSEQSGYQAATELLKQQPRITALFGGNDSMAIGAMHAAYDLGLRVPEDLTIIGFDGNVQSSLTTPPLTTLQVDVKVMAEATCMILDHAISRGMIRGIEMLVSAEFLVRGTTAAPAQ